MPNYATPGVYFEPVDQAPAGIAAIGTDIAAFLGIAERGPLHRPTPVNSWKEFQSTFGNFLPNAYLAYAAKAFFDNGGQKLYGVRVAAPVAGATTVTSPPVQPADRLSSIVDGIVGFARGAVVTASQTITVQATGAQPADRQSSVVTSTTGFVAGCVVLISQTVPAPIQSLHRVSAVDEMSKTIFWDVPLEAGFALNQPIQFQVFPRKNFLVQDINAATSTLVWETSLVPEFDVAQPIQFTTGASPAGGDLVDDNANATLRIEASSPGVWGNGLGVRVGRSSLAATSTSAMAQPVNGSASYVQSIVGFVRYSLVRIYQAHTPFPIIDYRTVTNVDPTTNALVWDTPLTPAFNVALPLSFETVEFSLTVYADGLPKESFAGLSLNPKHPRYVEIAVNPPRLTANGTRSAGQPSQLIRVKNLLAPDFPPANLPSSDSPLLNDGLLILSGGRDGIAALRPVDFSGDTGSEQKWGLRTLEDVDEVSILAAPDLLVEPITPVTHAPIPQTPPDICLPSHPPPQPAAPPPPQPIESAPRFTLDDIFRVQQAIAEHCQAMQFRFAILDPPDFGYPRQRIDLGEVQTWRQRFDTEFAALYYPWVFVNDPLPNPEVVRRIPPSGHVAGVYANTDLTEGVFKAPANVNVLWAQALTTDVSANQQGFLNPISVNCLRVFSGRGIRVFGSRTLSSEPAWRFVNVRRLVSMIEHALLISLQWVVFEPNNEYLWNEITASATGFLEMLWIRGALVGNTAEEAFFVKCNATNNPVAARENGQLTVEIGVAPSLPAEFIVFRIGRTGDSLEVSE